MRSDTFCTRNCVRRVTVSRRNEIHSLNTSRSDFWHGRPSRPTITKFSDTEPSKLVLDSKKLLNSSTEMFLDFGSNTRRTGASLPDSSRTVSSMDKINCLVFCCSGSSDFLPVFTFGLDSSSISSSTFWLDVFGGNSYTTSCHCPRANSSICQRARTLIEPLPVAYICTISFKLLVI